jgi:hypothetical protein
VGGLQVTARVTETDIFPVRARELAGREAQGRYGLVRWELFASGAGAVQCEVSCRLQGELSDPAVDTVVVPAGRRRVLFQTPVLSPLAYRGSAVMQTAMEVTAAVGGRRVMAEHHPVIVRAKNDVPWGQALRWSRYIAGWVTPHDDRVQEVLGRAGPIAAQMTDARGHRGVTLGRYELLGNRPDHVQANVGKVVEALYLAVKAWGLSYVSSSVHLHEPVQRVRFPRESLEQHAIACLDGTVLFASLFEALGLEPLVAIIPGHAMVGVRRVRKGGPRLLDSTYVPTAGFEQAREAARERAREAQLQGRLVLIDIAQERRRIPPLPFP